MAERWKPLPASAYKEDFRLRQPMLPATYKTTPVRTLQHRQGKLPRFRAKFTNVEKVLWPQEGYAKADVIAYYDSVSEAMLPQLGSRPLIMERYPNGIAEPYFLQKDALPQHTPDWMLPYVHEVYAPEVRRDVHYVLADHKDVLLDLANYAAITLHPWSSRLESLDFPDFVLFDLDPVAADFGTVQTVALALKSVLDELGLRAYSEDLRCYGNARLSTRRGTQHYSSRCDGVCIGNRADRHPTHTAVRNDNTICAGSREEQGLYRCSSERSGQDIGRCLFATSPADCARINSVELE
jgi:hypothetical protein